MNPRRPVRVAYFLREFPKLSETFILGEIVDLRRLGVEVRIVALEPAREARLHPDAKALLPEVLFVPQHVSGLPRAGGNPGRMFRMHTPASDRPSLRRAGEWAATLLGRWGADHFHAHFAGPAAAMAAAASECSRVPFSFTAHAKDIFSDSVDWRWVGALGRRAKALVTVCDYSRRFLARRLPGARVVRLYNGVDVEWWRPSRHPATPGHVVSVGRLVKKKGFHDLIEAVALLRDRGVMVKATVVGEGVERAALEAMVRSRSLESRFRMPGALTQPEVRALLRRAQVVAAPSVVEDDGNQDALPTVLLEAGACGVPAVATRVAGIPEIVRHRQSGILVPPGDARALARALEALLARPAWCGRLGRAARRRICARFNRRRSTEALVRLFSRASAEAHERSRHARIAS